MSSPISSSRERRWRRRTSRASPRCSCSRASRVAPPKLSLLCLGGPRCRGRGHGVSVFNGQVFPVDVAEAVPGTPLELTAGYRFRRVGFIGPYAGGGVGGNKYEETSAHSTAADD